MCHLSMKLSDISVKETHLKLDLEPKGQVHSKQQNNKQGNKYSNS